MWGDNPAPITKVSQDRGMWHIETDGAGFGFEVKYTLGRPDPAVGDEIICHTTQGSLVRGVTLRGEQLFYKTDAELEADRQEWVAKKKRRDQEKFEEQREELDAKFDSLPEVFQRRIQWFRDHNPDFRWEYEAYEMSCCLDALKIAEKFPTAKAVKRFKKMSCERQHKEVPGLYDGHSGNSWAFSVHLAWWYVQNPLWVILEHGALTPLVGCEDYGCAHPRPEDVMASVPLPTFPEGD